MPGGKKKEKNKAQYIPLKLVKKQSKAKKELSLVLRFLKREEKKAAKIVLRFFKLQKRRLLRKLLKVEKRIWRGVQRDKDFQKTIKDWQRFWGGVRLAAAFYLKIKQYVQQNIIDEKGFERLVKKGRRLAVRYLKRKGNRCKVLGIRFLRKEKRVLLKRAQKTVLYKMLNQVLTRGRYIINKIKNLVVIEVFEDPRSSFTPQSSNSIVANQKTTSNLAAFESLRAARSSGLSTYNQHSKIKKFFNLALRNYESITKIRKFRTFVEFRKFVGTKLKKEEVLLLRYLKQDKNKLLKKLLKLLKLEKKRLSSYLSPKTYHLKPKLIYNLKPKLLRYLKREKRKLKKKLNPVILRAEVWLERWERWLGRLRTKWQQIDEVGEKRKIKIEIPLCFAFLGWQPRLAFILKRTRKNPLWPFKKYWQEAVTVVLLISLLASSIWFYHPKVTQAATYTWFQTDWSGGATSSTAVHPTNQEGWAYFSAADSGMTTSTVGQLTLTPTPGSWTDTDFTGATTATTTISAGDVTLSQGAAIATAQIAAGGANTCALSKGGGIYCWGYNRFGELGDNSTTTRNTPVRVLKGEAASGDNDGTYLTNIKSISAGDYFACAVSNNDNAYCWGYNNYGQLGDNSTTDRSTPVRVLKGAAASGDNDGTNLTNIKSISAGQAHVCAVSNNNNAYCWGRNGYDNKGGQLGDNSTTDRSTPVRVLKGAAASGDNDGTNLTNIKSIDAGDYYQGHTCAVSNNDNAYCWGYNNYGQLGDNSTTQGLTPVRVLKGAAASGDNDGTNLTNIKSIDAGPSHTCAVSNNNNAYCWGYGAFGQLGYDSTNSTSTPIRVLKGAAASGDNDGTNLTNIKSIDTTSYNSNNYSDGTCAVSNNNNAYCWGLNGYGQLGDNSTTQRLTPIQVHGVNNVGYLDLGYTPPYYSSGTLTSAIQDTGQNSIWGTLSWNASTTASTSVTMKVRSCDDAACSGETAFSSCNTVASGSDISSNNCVNDGHRYIQYQATLSTIDTAATPTLHDVTVNYTYYLASATLTSSAYNASDAANVLSKIAWAENLPSNTDIKFQVRTATSSSGTWTSWCGPNDADSSTSTCATSTYFTDPTGGEAMDEMFTDGANDQWVQYKVWLETTNAAFTPTLSDVTLTYVVNTPPEFNPDYPSAGNGGVSASQGSDGSVAINYSVRDSDTNTGTVTPNYVTPSFEYSLNGGGSWTSATSACFAAGDWNNKSVATSSYTVHTATWNPACELGISNTTYSTTTQVRVTINDNEAANNTASQTSANFEIDTKPPTLGSPSISIDGSQSLALVTLSASDDTTALQMRIGLAADLSDASWVAYNSTTTKTLVTDPDTVYAQFKDAKSNTTAVQSATTPETPSAMMIQDTSNMNTSPVEYRLFIAWQVVQVPNPGFKQYSVLKSSDGVNYSSLTTISNRLTNYYGDTVNSSTTTYYYKVTSQDNNDNISYRSSAVYGLANGAQDSGEGGGGSEKTPPTISNVATSTVTTNGVTITWTTDELSNSTGGYSTSPGVFTTEQGVVSMVTSHSVVLTGLTPNTTYYFQVKSTDASSNTATDNNGGNGYTFTTNPGPTISNVAVAEVTNTTAKVTWTTNIDANSYVFFSTSSNLFNSQAYGSDATTTSHSVTIPGLTTGTRYYFYVRSIDDSSNIAYDKNVVGGVIEYYTFTTIQDTTAPTISNIVSTVSTSTAVVTWQTSELADSRLDYGTTTNYGSTQTSVTLTIQHNISLSGLLPSTTYHFRLIATDINSNTATSTDQTFTTAALADTTAPFISSVATSSVGLTSATITWTTDENANSIVEYGTATSSLNLIKGDLTESTTTHFVTLTGLANNTTYYFQVRSQDLAGNTATANNSGNYYTFTTLQDSTAPTITSGPTASIVSDTKATITWTTGELSTSQVLYGTSDAYGSQTTEDTTLTYQHSVTLTGLTKQTTYHYKVISKDAANNSANSLDATFTTTDAPGIVETIRVVGGGGAVIIERVVEKEVKPDSISPTFSDIKITSVDYFSVTITWKSSEPTDTFIEHGETTSYEKGVLGKYESQTSHSLTFTSLFSGTTYHFRVMGKDSSGNLGYSATQVFTTLKPAEVSEQAQVIALEKLPEEEKSALDIIKKGSQTFINEILKALTHNPFLSGIPEESFIASITEIAPKVVSPPQIGGDYPKVIAGPDWARITWLTDKKANSLVAFASQEEYNPAKSDPYPLEAGNSEEQVNTHIVELTGLRAATTYHYQVRSKSKLGDWAKSEDKTFTTLSLTPEISEVKFSSIGEREAFLTWQTNLPTKSEVQITNTVTGETLAIEDKSYLRDHQVTIKNLEVATSYNLLVIAESELGEKTFSQIVPFSTTVSLNPPIISQVRITTSLVPGKVERVQAIIAWKTDKPATSRVYFEEGITSKEDLALSTPLDKKFITDHIIITTAFKPGKVYQFKVESVDSFNNKSLSRTFTVLTPQPKENVVDMIISNFQETFGFLKRLKF